MIALPTDQQVADLHEQLLALHRGVPGSRAGTSVGAVLGRVQTNLAYQFENPTAAQAAAFAVYAFTVGHPFNDANKRTALAVGDLILLMNDEPVVAGEYQMELADLVIELAAGYIDQDSFMDSYVEMLGRDTEPA
ncbi:MAG: type II toxin-antitoxin system death-on-curing family toxin [Gammaproteobacteria bacterium]|nr:type II toxin-antitoxin system death-on-curing family toxin [Gammaproteobacteria bacterium]